MKAELQEWGPRGEFGDREDMGVHIYSEIECLRIVAKGGALEYHDGQFLNSEATVLDFFGQAWN